VKAALSFADDNRQSSGIDNRMAQIKLYGELGWGSVLTEAQLVWYGMDFDFETVGDLFKSADAQNKISEVNPLGQIPVLIMADGTVMTESAAITLHLADLADNDSLVPAAGSLERAAFLRWLIFIVANIYPTYTYGDEPSRFVSGHEGLESFKKAVDEYAVKMYGVLENQARQPWFLGERFSAIDIFICTMSRWQPGREWFTDNAPKLFAIATATEAVDSLKATWQRNFPND
jgi:GST-like protein